MKWKILEPTLTLLEWSVGRRSDHDGLSDIIRSELISSHAVLTWLRSVVSWHFAIRFSQLICKCTSIANQHIFCVVKIVIAYEWWEAAVSCKKWELIFLDGRVDGWRQSAAGRVEGWSITIIGSSGSGWRQSAPILEIQKCVRSKKQDW